MSEMRHRDLAHLQGCNTIAERGEALVDRLRASATNKKNPKWHKVGAFRGGHEEPKYTRPRMLRPHLHFQARFTPEPLSADRRSPPSSQASRCLLFRQGGSNGSTDLVSRCGEISARQRCDSRTGRPRGENRERRASHHLLERPATGRPGSSPPPWCFPPHHRHPPWRRNGDILLGP